jgi:hypothetical protein
MQPFRFLVARGQSNIIHVPSFRGVVPQARVSQSQAQGRYKMRYKITMAGSVIVLAAGVSSGQAGCESMANGKVTTTAKYGQVIIDTNEKRFEMGVHKSEGRVYFRPRNGACFGSIIGDSGDVVLGTGTLKSPGCNAKKTGYWEIDWKDDNRNTKFELLIDFMRSRYVISLFKENDTVRMCMDSAS